MNNDRMQASRRRYLIGAVIAAGFISALVGYGRFDGAERADEERLDSTALEQVHAPRPGETK